MPAYDYDCKGCRTVFEYQQSIKEEALASCPLCGSKKIERLVGNNIPFLFCKNEPTTVAGLAEANSKKMGWAEIQEREAKSQESRAAALERMSQHLPKGGSMDKPSNEKLVPWWRTGKLTGKAKEEKVLNLSKVSNIRKYVETGEKN